VKQWVSVECICYIRSKGNHTWETALYASLGQTFPFLRIKCCQCHHPFYKLLRRKAWILLLTCNTTIYVIFSWNFSPCFLLVVFIAMRDDDCFYWLLSGPVWKLNADCVSWMLMSFVSAADRRKKSTAEELN